MKEDIGNHQNNETTGGTIGYIMGYNGNYNIYIYIIMGYRTHKTIYIYKCGVFLKLQTRKSPNFYNGFLKGHSIIFGCAAKQR